MKMVWRTHGNICTSFFSMPSASFPLNAYWSFFIGVFDLVGAIDETQGPHVGIGVSTTTLLIFPSLFCNNEQAPNTCELWFLHYEVDRWPSLLVLYRENEPAIKVPDALWLLLFPTSPCLKRCISPWWFGFPLPFQLVKNSWPLERSFTELKPIKSSI